MRTIILSIRYTTESTKDFPGFPGRKKKNTYLMGAERVRIMLLGSSALNNYPIQRVWS